MLYPTRPRAVEEGEAGAPADPAVGVLNNLIVQMLRSGSAAQLPVYIGLGVRPEQPLDYVNANLPPEQQHQRHKIWFWAHLAPKADGVTLWWPLVHQRIREAAPADRATLLGDYFTQSCQAALSAGAHEVLTYSWAQFQRWHAEEPRWEPVVMMRRFMQALSRAGQAAIPVLEALHARGWLTAQDWSVPARQQYAEDPLEVLALRAQDEVVSTALTQGAQPFTRDGRALVFSVWRAFAQEDLAHPLPSDPAERTRETVLMRLLDPSTWSPPVRVQLPALMAEVQSVAHWPRVQTQFPALASAFSAAQMELQWDEAPAADHPGRRRPRL